MNDQVYCSIDLELSGFDPAKDEILEVGFVLFKLGQNEFEVIEEWTQVFKSHREVRHKILGLTGINQKELDEAPEFSQSRDFLKEKLSGTVLVGHGITLDIRFLEAFGVPCPPNPIDTLELVQWLLPTHHSYNLENLMHYFSISHREAHRALADSRAVIALIKKLLELYNSLSSEVQEIVKRIVVEHGFAWEALLDNQFGSKHAEQATESKFQRKASSAFEPNSVYIAPVGAEVAKLAIEGVPEVPTIVVLPDKHSVLSLWKDGAASGVFTGTDVFDNEKFNSLLNAPIESKDLALFALKLLVWRATNWQAKVILDLNLSFFGSQFKSLVTSDEVFFDSNEKLLVCDHRTFISLAKKDLFLDRFSIICGLIPFETVISSALGAKLSWYGALSALKSIYNPETETGDLENSEKILELLAATDLYFGLLALLLKQSFPSQSTVSLKDIEQTDSYKLTRIIAATEGYRAKLAVFSTTYLQIADLVGRIDRFLIESTNEVRWIEFGEHHVVLASQVLDIEPQMKLLETKVHSLSFVDTVQPGKLLDYSLARIGYGSFQRRTLDTTGHNKTICNISKEAATATVLQKHIDAESVPMVVVFNNLADLKLFYDKYYADIKQVAAIFAEKYSGGMTKLFRNFTIRNESVLLITAETLVKSTIKLGVKTLVVASPQLVQSSHPYNRELKAYWEADFPEFELLEEYLVLHEIFERCIGEKNQNCYVYGVSGKNDPKALLEFIKNENLFDVHTDIHS